MPSVLCLLHHPWLALFWFYQRKTLIRQERNGSIYSVLVAVFIVVGSMLKVDLVGHWATSLRSYGHPKALALLALSGVVASICKNTVLRNRITRSANALSACSCMIV